MQKRTGFWLITAAAVVGLLVTAALGRWQLGRADEKQALQARVEARGQQDVIDGASLAGEIPAEELLQRRITARGRWLPEHTVFLDNRPMQGRVGFYIVTPLRLAGQEAVVLVQRGWVPRDFSDRSRVPAIETPGGLVEVQGRIVPPPSKLYELGEAGRGTIRQNLDVADFRAETGLPLAAVSIQQTGPDDGALVREWPVISAGVDKHYGYAFQWFGLSALIAVLYVWFQIVKPYRARR